MKKQKVFLCYTLRGTDLTSVLLEQIKRRMQATGRFEVYVDVLDNPDKVNPQQFVIDRLHEADMFCIIRSQMIEHSKWVRRELTVANSRGIPKVELTVTHIMQLLDTKSDEEFFEALQGFFMLSDSIS